MEQCGGNVGDVEGDWNGEFNVVDSFLLLFANAFLSVVPPPKKIAILDRPRTIP